MGIAKDTVMDMAPLVGQRIKELEPDINESLSARDLVNEDETLLVADQIIYHILKGGVPFDKVNEQYKYQVRYNRRDAETIIIPMPVPPRRYSKLESKTCSVNLLKQRLKDYYINIEFADELSGNWGDLIVTMPYENLWSLGEKFATMIESYQRNL